MSPLLVVAGCLAVLYILGREFDRYGRNVERVLSPSRCEHVCPDEEFDSWAATWEAAYLEDELERWAKLPTREHA
jgi:hypothetical protein